MMSKVTLRNLAAHKLRLVLTALSVILGVAFVAGTLIFTDTVNKSFDDLLGESGKNISVDVRAKRTDDGQQEVRTDIAVPESLAASLAKVPGVESAHGTIEAYTAIVDKEGKLLGGGGPPQFGLNWDPQGDTKLTTGRPPAAAAEVAIDTRTAEKAGYKVGDQIKVAVEGGVQNVKIVGLVDGEDFLGATVTVWETKTAQQLLLKPGEFSHIWLKSAPGVSDKELLERVKPTLPGTMEVITGQELRDENQSDINSSLNFLRYFLLVFAAVSILVGGFNIFNTFSMLVGQRTKELALLRAVGASRRQVTRAVLGEAFVVGVVGSTLGFGLGAGLAAGLKALFGAQGLEVNGGLVFTPTSILWAYGVGIVVTCVSCYFPARRAAKIPPVAAMRDDIAMPQRSLKIRAIVGAVVGLIGAVLMGLGLTGSGSAQQSLSILGLGVVLVFIASAMFAPLLSKPIIRVISGWFPKVFGVAGKMAKENPQRNPRRTAVTAVALMIGLSLVTMVNVVSASMKSSINEIVDRQFGADYAVFANGPVGLDPKVGDAVRAVPGVTKSVALGEGDFTLKINGKLKEDGYATGNPDDLFAATNTKLVAGDTKVGTDGLLLSEEQAKKDGLKVGSTVEAVFPDTKSQTLRVTGLYTESEFIGSRLLSTEAWKAHTAKPLAFLLALEVTKPDAATKTAIESAIKPFPGVELQDPNDLKEEIQSELNGIVTFLTLMLALSVIIAIFGVINTIVLSVTERTRELGLLRAVGLSRRQLRRMVRLESVAIAIFGGLLGIGLGVGFGTAIQRSAGDEMQVLDIPLGFLLACLFFSFIVGILASLWPAWRAGRMDVLKAIATE